MIIDVLKRAGNDISKEREKASIVSISYRSSLYSTHRVEIDYGIAQKLDKGNLFVDYDYNRTLCTIYNIIEKMTDKFNNIILIVDEEERVSFEDINGDD